MSSTKAQENDKVRLHEGVKTIVNALSVRNPGAKEFAAVSLIILSSQGGYEVKTLAAEAGALQALLNMISDNHSVVTRELAAAAVAGLVSFHPPNRGLVLRSGGVKALVNMAKSTCLVTDNVIKTRIQAAAAFATFHLSEPKEFTNGVENAFAQVALLLSSDDVHARRAGLGGLRVMVSSQTLSFEHILALLNLTKDKASEEYAFCELEEFFTCEGIEDVTREGVNLLLSLLESSYPVPGLADVFIRIIFGTSLADCVSERQLVSTLMRLVTEKYGLTTRVLAMSCIANYGAKHKKLELNKHELSTALKILSVDPGKYEKDIDCYYHRQHVMSSCMSCYYHQQHAKIFREMFKLQMCLRENATAVILYFALSGKEQADEIVSYRGVPLLVQLIRGESSPPDSGIFQNLEVAHEYALMALIVLSEKCSTATEEIVQAGGIAIFLEMLTTSGVGSKFGAPWSEMAAAALLTIASFEVSRLEMIKCDVVSSILQILKDRDKISSIAQDALVQLLGVLNDHKVASVPNDTK